MRAAGRCRVEHNTPSGGIQPKLTPVCRRSVWVALRQSVSISDCAAPYVPAVDKGCAIKQCDRGPGWEVV